MHLCCIMHFFNRLSDMIKEELAAHEHPSDLDDFIPTAIRVDVRLQEGRRERAIMTRPRESLRLPQLPLSSWLVPVASKLAEPMQLGWTRSTTTE